MGGGALKTSLKSYLKIVPQIMQKTLGKSGFPKVVFARFEVQFDVQQIVPQIVPVFLCDRIDRNCDVLPIEYDLF